MNNTVRALSVSMILILSSLAGCLSDDETTVVPDENNLDDLVINYGTVMVSTYHVGELVSAVAGDSVTLEYMSQDNIPVHDYEPSAADLIRLQEADLFFYHGLNLEPWVDSTLSSLGDDAPPSYMTHTMPSGESDLAYESMLVSDLCELMTDGPFESTTLGMMHDDHDDHDDHGDDDHDDHGDDDHGDDDHDDHGDDDHDDHGDGDHDADGTGDNADTDDDHGDDDHDDHGDDDHGDDGDEIVAGDDEDAFTYDPHSWLSPIAFEAQVNVVLASLSSTFPNGSAAFTENAASYSVQLMDLHERFMAAFGEDGTCDMAGQDKTIVANHNAYSYMSVQYDIDIITLHGLDPEGEPSPADIAEVVESIEEKGITVLFVEEYTDQTAVNSIVEQTGVSLEILYTMEMAPSDSTDNYLSMMNKNLENIISGCGC